MLGTIYQRHRQIIKFALGATAIFLVIFLSQTNFTANLRRLYYLLLYPFHRASSEAIGSVQKNLQYLKKINELAEELEKTRGRLQQYEDKYSDYERLYRDNMSMRALLDFRQQSIYPSTAAEIISKDPQNLYDSFIINKGSDAGIELDMPVIAYHNGIKAAAGKVIEVFPSAARIITLLDPRCMIGVKIDRSGEIGICHGETPKNFGCRIEYLNRQAEIFEGDVAVTSGLGGIFPKNILIGTISTVDKKNFGLFASAALKPYIELSHLEYVLVLKKEKNKWPEK